MILNCTFRKSTIFIDLFDFIQTLVSLYSPLFIFFDFEKALVEVKELIPLLIKLP